MLGSGSATGRNMMAPARLLFASLALLALFPSTQASGQEYQLFDRFSFGIGGGWNKLGTTIRLDSTEFDRGTELDFESDTALDDSKTVPDFRFEWHPGRRHLIRFFYNSIDRDASSQALQEIHFGDLVVPVNADIRLAFDIEQYLIGYSYYPWLKDRVAVGFTTGIRVLDILTSLRIESTQIELPTLFEEADVTGPLPFIGVEVRYGISPKWRLVGGAGYLDLDLGDLGGGQTLIDLRIEHLAAKHFSWAFELSKSNANADAEGEDFMGRVDLDIDRAGLFVKGRW
jgi:hypothetical protein